MDIEKLKKIIEDSLKDGVFSLDVTKLESPGITVLGGDAAVANDQDARQNPNHNNDDQ